MSFATVVPQKFEVKFESEVVSTRSESVKLQPAADTVPPVARTA